MRIYKTAGMLIIILSLAVYAVALLCMMNGPKLYVSIDRYEHLEVIARVLPVIIGVEGLLTAAIGLVTSKGWTIFGVSLLVAAPLMWKMSGIAINAIYSTM